MRVSASIKVDADDRLLVSTIKVDANDKSLASTTQVDADEGLLASNSVDANTLDKNKKNKKQIRVEDHQCLLKVDADNVLIASTFGVNADEVLLASNIVDANTLEKNKKQIKVEHHQRH